MFAASQWTNTLGPKGLQWMRITACKNMNKNPFTWHLMSGVENKSNVKHDSGVRLRLLQIQALQ